MTEQHGPQDAHVTTGTQPYASPSVQTPSPGNNNTVVILVVVIVLFVSAIVCAGLLLLGLLFFGASRVTTQPIPIDSIQPPMESQSGITAGNMR